jgi:hypothetical protein
MTSAIEYDRKLHNAIEDLEELAEDNWDESRARRPGSSWTTGPTYKALSAAREEIERLTRERDLYAELERQALVAVRAIGEAAHFQRLGP